MLPAPVDPKAPPPGTWPLFKFRGIRVFLHWSWILVAVYHINDGKGFYSNIAWDIAQYVTLFVIVLMHEFGHAFATRQVGGTADQILLWPFGGIAYVQTPPRPGAYLWGIAAGPLVNAVLWPVLFGIAYFTASRATLADLNPAHPTPTGELAVFCDMIFTINKWLLIFNLLPIYPMDGGQLLRGLLWLKVGPVKSVLIAAWVGLVLGAAVAVYALVVWRLTWLPLIMALMLFQSWATIQRIYAARRDGLIPR